MVLIRKECFKTIHKVSLLVEVVKLHFKFTLSNESFTSQILLNYAHIYSFTLENWGKCFSGEGGLSPGLSSREIFLQNSQ